VGWIGDAADKVFRCLESLGRDNFYINSEVDISDRVGDRDAFLMAVSDQRFDDKNVEVAVLRTYCQWLQTRAG
jgi:hypothetical protein